MPVFTIKDIGGDVSTFTTDQDVITIGRSKSCTIALDDNAVSAVHAIIISKLGHHYIYDQKSKNGIFVNGQSVKSCSLKNNDEIKIGSSSITFQKSVPHLGSIRQVEPVKAALNFVLHGPKWIKVSDSIRGEVRVLEKPPLTITVISLHGKINEKSIPQIEDFFSKLLDNRIKKLVLDMKELQYMSAEGWNLLALQAKKFQLAGGKLVLCRLGGQVEESFCQLNYRAVIDSYWDALIAIKAVAESFSLQISDGRENRPSLKLSLAKQVKEVIGKHGPLSISQIRKKIAEPEFGGNKVSHLKIYTVLRQTDLLRRKNREAYYRSC